MTLCGDTQNRKFTADEIEEQRQAREDAQMGEYAPKPRPIAKTLKELYAS